MIGSERLPANDALATLMVSAVVVAAKNILDIVGFLLFNFIFWISCTRNARSTLHPKIASRFWLPPLQKLHGTISWVSPETGAGIGQAAPIRSPSQTCA
ncbi:hypothetical protein OAN307_c22540 [Octadecabacter antarcticus 307]|uniref:Uncharacterized protein n=1 Tax=Octadecabacter antarcticus 307 TaxID=391626 RepID=M9R7Y3_9RHOB|nr:hypothetical protein OAN307_c22540 [Octadecabacter antarcticus 307]